jgi:hypothetical protein
MASSGWKRLRGSRSASIEIHIGPAIATFFFNDYSSFEPAKCYLLPNAIDRLDPFLPMLERLVGKRPFSLCCHRNTQFIGSVSKVSPFAVCGYGRYNLVEKLPQ